MKAPFWSLVIVFSLMGWSYPVLAQANSPRLNRDAEQPMQTDTPMGSAADLRVYDADLSTIDLAISRPLTDLSLPSQAESSTVSPSQPNNSLIWLPNNEAPSDRLNLSGS